MLFNPLTILCTCLAILATSAPLSRRMVTPGAVIASNFADPAFITVNNLHYAFSTNHQGMNVPMASSVDMIGWTLLGEAMPKVGAWSTGKAVWAPHVVQLPSQNNQPGTFVMYYTALSKANPTFHCVGAATSASISGPYIARDEVFACSAGGGSIDPSGFHDDGDGRQYVVYKTDGNNIGHGGNCNNGVAPIVPTPIMLQEVNPANGYELIGGPTQILDRGPADGPLIEAPSLIRVPNTEAPGTFVYILFFSSNCFTGGLYDTSYATSINGITNGGQDYEKSSTPLLVTGSNNGRLYSPGGMTVGPEGVNAVFHADLGTTHTVRQMWYGVLDIKGRTVSIL
ncbi:hypothetical protein MMC11_004639 [Xylographa trunciseda]|nr:hypothetical protein [Xylographa trunciseda]